jgi:uncharacterized repeat protein (TIGR01451 family)
MSHQWIIRGTLLLIAAAGLGLGLLPLATPSQAAPPLALTASAEPPTRTRVPGPAPAPAITPTPAIGQSQGGGGPEIDLSISKTVSPDSAAPGEQVTFVLTVNCTGRGQADNVLISDVLPPGLTLVSATTSWGNLTSDASTVRVRIPVLYAGDQVTVRIVAQVDPGAQGSLVNRAEVTSDTEDSDPTNNTASATVIVLQPSVTPTGLPTANPLPTTLPATGQPRSEGPGWPLLALLSSALVGMGLAARGRSSR